MDDAVHLQRIHTPVKREAAERYVLVSLVSFGATVIVTRVFLELTGYPQLAARQLHIAHVLWGGLLLFIAALFPLILANQWALTVGAVLSGVGVGLFIDEVGKFITRDNDYFYPPAAAIIYAFFLLTVLLYLQVRRSPAENARALMYRVLEGLTEVLDRDLQPEEHAALKSRLQRVARESRDPQLVRLARDLLAFLDIEGLRLVTRPPGAFQRWLERVLTLIQRFFARPRLKLVLIVGFGWVGFFALIQLIGLLIAVFNPDPVTAELTAALVTDVEAESVGDVLWFTVRIVLEGGVGILYTAAVVLLLAGRDRIGLNIGIMSLLVSLTAVNLLVFYLDQFQAVFGTLVQWGLLWSATSYRRRFLS